IISKWDESGSKLSYKLDIITTSNAFGDGSDSSITFSTNQTETVIDANCSGTVGTNTLAISNVTGVFAIGQKIYIHQTRGANHGSKQITTIIGGDLTTTLTLADNLTFSPTHSATTSVAEKAQVRVMKQYTNGTINNGVVLTLKAWDGLKGGLGLIDNFNGTFTNNGTITGTGKGFRGASSVTRSTRGNISGLQGEGTGGLSGTTSSASNGNGGGGGTGNATGSTAGGGGGNAATGTNGAGNGVSSFGAGGDQAGSTDLTSIDLGGSGGSGGLQINNSPATATS